MIKITKYFNLKLDTGIFGENVFELIFYYRVANGYKKSSIYCCYETILLNKVYEHEYILFAMH